MGGAYIDHMNCFDLYNRTFSSHEQLCANWLFFKHCSRVNHVNAFGTGYKHIASS